jgi:hypothetical protein
MGTDKTPAQGVHDCNHEPLMTAPRLAVIGVGATARFVTRSSRRSVSHRHQPSNGHSGIRLAPGDRRHAGAGIGLYVLARPLAAL